MVKMPEKSMFFAVKYVLIGVSHLAMLISKASVFLCCGSPLNFVFDELIL